ncbi:hypothetical protein COLO4_09660 [Corchorus olitorius]|uniref:Uncharacterized protein n=1 Tax=Corchorus olitorius TaxID=93759 RepID=A0A1R3KBF9_9ROSI|nr:hypothetical protein COLO4_09660 [Corchorus olitorius]
MKVTGKATLPATFSGRNHTDADLRPTTKRKARNTRWKRVGAQGVGRRSRPETPLLKWKMEEKERAREKGGGGGSGEVEQELEEEEEGGRRGGGRGRRKKAASTVSARKLAAGLWRLQLPETVTAGAGEKRRDRLGFKPGNDFTGVPFLYHHKDKLYGSDAKDPLQSPGSASVTKNGLLRKIEPSIQFSNSAMEGATKWDPVCLKTTDEVRKIYSHMKRIDQQDSLLRHSNVYVNHNDEIEEDESGWETVSHLEDQGSSYSPEGSAASVNKNRRDSNFSGSGTDWEENACGETPMTEISEVCSLPGRQLKKVSSIARLWRSCPNNGENYKIISVDGTNGRLSNGRKSNGSILSPDRGSGKGGLSPPDLVGQWSSPDSSHPHITRGMKGCIEWPRGAQKNSLKAKLMEARMESQKVQLRHVLKQKF